MNSILFCVVVLFFVFCKAEATNPLKCLKLSKQFLPTKSVSFASQESSIPQLLTMKGGEIAPTSFKEKTKHNLLGLWGIIQVVSITANAIKRLLPIAIRPFTENNFFTPQLWAMYIIFSLIMAYSEGYRGFHLKFSPMVVNRAFNLHNNTSFINVLLAGPYSMGMFGASRKRMIVSWGITAGVFSLVKLVKYLPHTYRSVVDGGVVVGLTLGTLSICYYTLKTLFGSPSRATEIKDE